MFPLSTTSSYRAFCPAMISSSVLRTESSSNKYTCFSTLYRLLETRNSHLTIQCRFLSNIRQRRAILVLYATIHLTATQSHSAKTFPTNASPAPKIQKRIGLPSDPFLGTINRKPPSFPTGHPGHTRLTTAKTSTNNHKQQPANQTDNECKQDGKRELKTQNSEHFHENTISLAARHHPAPPFVKTTIKIFRSITTNTLALPK